MPRPLKTFHDMVGQRVPVKHVTVMIDGSQVLAKPCPSLLLTAAPGYGKTTFAEAVAAAVGSTLYTLLAAKDLRPVDLCITLYSMNFSDVLLIDEAHSLTVDAQQVLYVALDQQKKCLCRENMGCRGGNSRVLPRSQPSSRPMNRAACSVLYGAAWSVLSLIRTPLQNSR